MRVLAVVIAHPWRKVSGATNAALQLSRALSRHCGIEVALMWDSDGESIEDSLSISHLRCYDRTGPWLAAAPRSLRIPLQTADWESLLDRRKYDLVHVHNLIPTLAARDLVRSCLGRKIPTVITTHGFFELAHYARIRNFNPLLRIVAYWLVTRPFRQILRDCRHYFILSPNETELMQDLGVPPDSLALVTNGVNEFYLQQPTAEELEAVEQRWPRVSGTRRLMFMGSLHEYKGVDVALRCLLHSKSAVHLLVAGSFKNESEKSRLLSRCLPESEWHRVTFTGRVSDEELRALYHSSDVFVYPTRGDTLPLVILEAMAQGLPVVSTPIAGVPYEVTAECGRIVPVDDPVATAAACDAILGDSALCAEMGRAARERVENVFTWSRAAEAAHGEYRKILGHAYGVIGTMPEFCEKSYT